MKSLIALAIFSMVSASFAASNITTVEVVEAILTKRNSSGELQYVNGCKFLLRSHSDLCGSENLKLQMLEKVAMELPTDTSELTAKDLDQLTAEIAALVTPGWEFSDKRDIAERWAAKQLRMELNR